MKLVCKNRKKKHKNEKKQRSVLKNSDSATENVPSELTVDESDPSLQGFPINLY